MVIIDFSAIKGGGGAQIAMNFLQAFDESNFKYDVLFLLPDTGPLSRGNLLMGNKRFIIVRSSNIFKRLLFEKITYPQIVKNKGVRVCYSFFGAGLPKLQSVKQITTVAYPIICYDESMFWSYLKGYRWIIKKIVNHFRKQRIASSDLVLVETIIMRQRLMNSLQIRNIDLLPPAVSGFVNLTKIKREKKTILVLSGNAPHKNLWRLPAIALGLQGARETIDFEFIVTVAPESFNTQLPASITCIGSVNPEEVGVLYCKSEFLLSLSDLESFSNNYMEAWASRTLLIVSDRDFARDICKDSAFYLEPHEVEDSVRVINRALNLSNEEYEAMLDHGEDNLQSLPTHTERTKMILDRICELY